MKKYIAIILCICLFASLAACGKKDGGKTGLANPLTESTKEELETMTGVKLNIPDTAENVVYSVIDMGENDIAQTDFVIGGIAYCYRIQKLEELTDISGANYEWTSDEAITVNEMSGEAHFIDGEEGYCAWYDTDAGLCFCLFMETGADATTLLTMARQIGPSK